MARSTAPPNNIEAEQAVLGALLLDPKWAIPNVQPILNGGEFYLQKHRWVYEAMIALNAQRTPIDFLTLSTQLENQQKLEAIGGAAYLSQLLNSVPSTAHAVNYAKLVQQAYVRRRILDACTTAARLAYDEGLDIEHVISEAEGQFLNIRDGLTYQERLRPLDQVLSELYTVAEQYYHANIPLGTASGLSELDTLLDGGLRPGTLSIVAARPGVGKSTLLGALASSALNQQVPTALFSIEMRGLEVAGRIIQKKLGLHYLKLKDEDWPAFAAGIGQLSEQSMWIDDSPRLAIEDLRTKARRLYAQNHLGLLELLHNKDIR